MTDPVTNNEEVVVEEDLLEGGDERPEGSAVDIADESGETDDLGTDTNEVTDAGEGEAASETEDAAEPDEAEEAGQTEDDFARLNDLHLRLVAEFNNYRRRTEQERLTSWSRAQAELVGKIVEVLDDLHRVADLDLTNATVEAIMEGIDLVERKFVRVVEDSGVEMMDPVGEVFDPELMEAMMRVPAESDDQVDTVAQVFQKGYSLKGILVRPARVSVYTQG